MNEDKDRRAGLIGAKDVELLDRRVAIGTAQRFADPRPHADAVAGPAFVELQDVRLVDRLIVGRVEFDLVVIEKNQRSFFVRRWPAIWIDARRRQDDSCRLVAGTHGRKTAKHLSELKM